MSFNNLPSSLEQPGLSSLPQILSTLGVQQPLRANFPNQALSASNPFEHLKSQLSNRPQKKEDSTPAQPLFNLLAPQPAQIDPMLMGMLLKQQQ
jgi:hypothetical protein